MRRALLVAAALAVPTLGVAQIPTGTVQFVEPGTTNDIVHGQWINATKCANQATTNVVLQWTVQMATGASYPSNGSYQIYAANQDMPANTIECPKLSVSASGLIANPVGVSITGQLQNVANVTETVQAFLTAVQQTSCNITSDVTIYVCVQLRDSNNTSVGFAKGQLYFSIAAPAAPTNVSVSPLETGKLRVTWSAPGGSPPAYDYIVRAHSVLTPTPPAPPDPTTQDPLDTAQHQAGPTDPNVTQATLSGLTDGVMYAVYVAARSKAANESVPPAGPAYGVPKPVRDFWDVYRATPGAVEQGGCATAGAGSLALAGLATVVAGLRRRG